MSKNHDDDGNESEDSHTSAFQKFDEDSEVFDATTIKLTTTPSTDVKSLNFTDATRRRLYDT